jgi:hypothetical protein
MTEAPPTATRSPRERAALTVLLVGIAYGFLVLGLQTPLLQTPIASPLLFVSVLVTFSLAYRWGLHRDRWFVLAWVAVAIGLAVQSIVTGYLNGLTDEGYATPEFVRLFPNLYGSSLTLAQNHTTYGYVYLPLLPWIQVPGLDYRWVTVGAWVATLYLTRANRVASVILGAPWVGILAASGFNDFVPILFLTLWYVTLSGAGSRAAEIVGLGLKQFANVIVVGYYLALKRWWEAAFAVAVTIAFLVPFAFLDASGVVCHALLLNANPNCSGAFGVSSLAVLVSHLNYWVWPLFVLAVFGPPAVVCFSGPKYAADRARVARWLGRSEYRTEGAGWSLFLIPLAHLFRSRDVER